VSFLGLDRELRVVSISSARSAEGKTATCANLATVLARAGHQVVVVDCDLRKPRLHEFLGLPQAPGLTTAVLGGGLDELVRTVDSVPGLTLLSAGEVPPDPAELLASTRTAEVFTQLREGYDIVIVDTAPVLPVTDALIVSKLADATLLVGSVTGSSRRDVHRARELLDQVQAPLVGAVLNNVRAGSDDGYGYGRRPGPTETGDDSKVTPPTRAADADAHSPSV
jgi:capsular exopolysaccharide synthesis family protein